MRPSLTHVCAFEHSPPVSERGLPITDNRQRRTQMMSSVDSGLSDGHAARRLATHGPNDIPLRDVVLAA